MVVMTGAQDIDMELFIDKVPVLVFDGLSPAASGATDKWLVRQDRTVMAGASSGRWNDGTTVTTTDKDGKSKMYVSDTRGQELAVMSPQPTANQGVFAFKYQDNYISTCVGLCEGVRAAKYPRFSKSEWGARIGSKNDLKLQGSTVTTEQVIKKQGATKGEGTEWIFIKPDHPRHGKKFADIILKQKVDQYDWTKPSTVEVFWNCAPYTKTCTVPFIPKDYADQALGYPLAVTQLEEVGAASKQKEDDNQKEDDKQKEGNQATVSASDESKSEEKAADDKVSAAAKKEDEHQEESEQKQQQVAAETKQDEKAANSKPNQWQQAQDGNAFVNDAASEGNAAQPKE
jgi:hypothetical protein